MTNWINGIEATEEEIKKYAFLKGAVAAKNGFDRKFNEFYSPWAIHIATSALSQADLLNLWENGWDSQQQKPRKTRKPKK